MATNLDGRYILQPEGSAWLYARVKGGQVVSSSDEATVATHVAARDSLAWLGDVDFEALRSADLNPEDHAAIVRLVMGDHILYPDMVDVMRV